jgi:hypothetical protein
MHSLYNQVAGKSVERLSALSDGWSYATRARLLAEDTPAEIHSAVVRRIAVAQSLYAAGAALCFFNTYYSIAAIVLVQVNYAIAPRFCWGLFSRHSAE